MPKLHLGKRADLPGEGGKILYTEQSFVGSHLLKEPRTTFEQLTHQLYFGSKLYIGIAICCFCQ